MPRIQVPVGFQAHKGRAALSQKSFFVHIFVQRDGASNTHVPRETAPVEDTYDPYNTIGPTCSSMHHEASEEPA